jgi:hypothetical protein
MAQAAAGRMFSAPRNFYVYLKRQAMQSPYVAIGWIVGVPVIILPWVFRSEQDRKEGILPRNNIDRLYRALPADTVAWPQASSADQVGQHSAYQASAVPGFGMKKPKTLTALQARQAMRDEEAAAAVAESERVDPRTINDPADAKLNRFKLTVLAKLDHDPEYASKYILDGAEEPKGH